MKRDPVSREGHGPGCVLLIVGCLALPSCAVERPLVDDLLAPAQPAPELGENPERDALDPGSLDPHAPPALGPRRLAVDRTARAARKVARASPQDPRAQIEASLALYRAVDMRIQRAILETVRRVIADPETTGQSLLAAEDRSVIDLGVPLQALCEEGRDFAEAALDLGASGELRAAALHLRALHMTLGAQAMGAPRAMFGGVGRRLVQALETSLAEAPHFDLSAPRTLYGRFLDRAPWPYQDRERGVAELERSTASDPGPLPLLFLGDALFGLGDQYERAVETWRDAATAPGDPQRSPLNDLYRERARARVLLVDDGRI